MNISNINFGTSVHISASQNILLSKQPESFLDGLLLAESKLSNNRIKDEFILNLQRVSDDPKSDTLTLSYISPTGEFSKEEIIKKIKDLPKKTKKIEQFLLDSFAKLQPPEVRVKTVHLRTDKKQDKATLKLAKANYFVDKNGFDDFTCA